MERGWREISPNCPRCGSSNTKFCYYNNYSLTQPRYFCKGCRRYWTKGGSLRNVPIGGGCRKSRRSRSLSLRLPSSNHHHHHHHHLDHDHDHVATTSNHELRHSSYGNPRNTTMVESPSIDLAVVYANFLTQKPEINEPIMGVNSNPSLQDHTNNNNPPFSQGLTVPESNNNHDDDDDHNEMFITEFSRSSIHPHHHEETSIHQEYLGLPPLPGESSSSVHDHHHHRVVPWAPSSHDHHHHSNNLEAQRIIIPDLEPDSQFSNLFIGSWSPLDLPGFQTSSSSSKP